MSVLKGKRVLITGASRGVGRQVALALAEQGCELVLHSRDGHHTQPLVEQLRGQGVVVESVAAELSDLGQVDALIDELLPKGVDILYNNAAVMTPWRKPYTATVADYELSFKVNVIALARLCDRLIPPMLEKRWGRVVNVTSGIEYTPELLPYSMSKAAVDRYVRDLSPSLAGTGVVMSLLDPGWLRTDLGGPNAPNDVSSCRPGVVVPLLVQDDAPSGQLYCAQDYAKV
jgi:3-oxoacyl-[acyl-carrier protein] reductase